MNKLIISDKNFNLDNVGNIQNLNLTWFPSLITEKKLTIYNFDSNTPIYQNTESRAIYVSCSTIVRFIPPSIPRIYPPPPPIPPPSPYNFNVFAYSDETEKPTTLVCQKFGYFPTNPRFTLSFIVPSLHYYTFSTNNIKLYGILMEFNIKIFT